MLNIDRGHGHVQVCTRHKTRQFSSGDPSLRLIHRLMRGSLCPTEPTSRGFAIGSFVFAGLTNVSSIPAQIQTTLHLALGHIYAMHATTVQPIGPNNDNNNSKAYVGNQRCQFSTCWPLWGFEPSLADVEQFLSFSTFKCNKSHADFTCLYFFREFSFKPSCLQTARWSW